jgi:hypothetical protein
MGHQVTPADYQRCTLNNACPPAPSVAEAVDRPAVKISWYDANAYAGWLSHQLGVTYRLYIVSLSRIRTGGGRGDRSRVVTDCGHGQEMWHA